jgi:hypothetical protein
MRLKYLIPLGWYTKVLVNTIYAFTYDHRLENEGSRPLSHIQGVDGLSQRTGPHLYGRADGISSDPTIFGYILLNTTNAFTYDHRLEKMRDPVRSPISKLQIGRLVVGWVTTSEYLLLYVFWFFFRRLCDRKADQQMC